MEQWDVGTMEQWNNGTMELQKCYCNNVTM